MIIESFNSLYAEEISMKFPHSFAAIFSIDSYTFKLCSNRPPSFARWCPPLQGAVKNPFRGTSIAAYMKGFEQRRSNRFHAHFDMSPELVLDKRDDIKGGTSDERVARRHVQLLDERVQAQQQREEIAPQLEQEKSKLAMLKEQDRDLAPRMRDAQLIYDKAERSLSWAQSTQQSRGLFKKLLHGASDQAKVDELTQELEQAQQVYEDIWKWMEERI